MNKVKCPKCGYEWLYKGKLKRCTCPNCGNKVSTAKPEETLESLLQDSKTEEYPALKMLREYLQSSV
jgi:DNA-directed RNA polymerase subunit RPC12/RpoP